MHVIRHNRKRVELKGSQIPIANSVHHHLGDLGNA